MWKGDSVGYTALHSWVKRRYKKTPFCMDCKLKPPYDLANISQEYKRDLSDWEWLCRSCHMKKDGRFKIIHYSRPCSEKNKILTSIRFKGKKRPKEMCKIIGRSHRKTSYKIAQELRSLYPSKKISELSKMFSLTRRVVFGIVKGITYNFK